MGKSDLHYLLDDFTFLFKTSRTTAGTVNVEEDTHGISGAIRIQTI